MAWLFLFRTVSNTPIDDSRRRRRQIPAIKVCGTVDDARANRRGCAWFADVTDVAAQYPPGVTKNISN